MYTSPIDTTDGEIWDLRTMFHFRNEAGVAAWIKRYPTTVPLLKATHVIIFQEFGDGNLRTDLDVEINPDQPFQTKLLIAIQTDLKLETVEKRFDAFIKGWWERASRVTPGPLVVEVEICDGD